MEALKAHGEYPQTVYRVFDNTEYAKDFTKGQIRFSLLQSYKSIEDDLRKDISEGEAHVVYNNVNRHSSFASNRFYILSFHRSLESAQRSKFGNIIVKITNPIQLASEITKWLEQQDFKHFGGIEGVNIEYTHGEKVKNKLISTELARLTYSQKPESFKDENEFRFIFIRKSCQNDYVFIELNGAEENCKIIQW